MSTTTGQHDRPASHDTSDGQRDSYHDGLLRELSEEECWAHLAAHGVGRIAYVDRTGPVVLPLNYAAHDQKIWIRTASYNQLAVHLPGRLAAFEIDQVDRHSRAGWSVLVRGRVEHVLDAGVTQPWPEPTPWPSGTRTMMFCLTPTTVTGRALKQGDVSPTPGRGPGTTQRSVAGTADHRP